MSTRGGGLCAGPRSTPTCSPPAATADPLALEVLLLLSERRAEPVRPGDWVAETTTVRRLITDANRREVNGTLDPNGHEGSGIDEDGVCEQDTWERELPGGRQWVCTNSDAEIIDSLFPLGDRGTAWPEMSGTKLRLAPGQARVLSNTIEGAHASSDPDAGGEWLCSVCEAIGHANERDELELGDDSAQCVQKIISLD